MGGNLQCIQDGAQCVFMLIGDIGSKAAVDLGADDCRINLSRNVGISIVECNDQNAVTARLKIGLVEDRSDIIAEPGIGRRRAAIMGIVQQVGNNNGVLGQCVIGQISGKLGEGHHVLLGGAAVDD